MAFEEFTFRDYQCPIVEAVEKYGYKRILPIIPRRGGKDITALEIAHRFACSKPATVWYIFPTYQSARDSIWDGLTNTGKRILDLIPDEICKKNSSMMKITYHHNGSVIKFMGSEKYHRLRGGNPHFVIFSEYAFQNPAVFDEVISPVLAGNDGIAMFISTPFGKNHFWDLYQEALGSPEDWYTLKLTCDDTKHISAKNLAREKKRLSHPKFMQEYFTSFECGIAGSIYGQEMQDMMHDGRLSDVAYDPAYPVHVSFDIGVKDSTAVIFFQIVNNQIYIIDCYDNTRKSASHYIQEVRNRGYIIGKWIVPHDIKILEWGSGLTRIAQFVNHGIAVTHAPKPCKGSLLKGIESVRVTLRRVHINEAKCKPLLKSLNNYHFKWDTTRNRFIDTEPYHDWSSDYADSMRYLCTSQHLLQKDLTPEQLDDIRSSATSSMLGPRSYGRNSSVY